MHREEFLFMSLVVTGKLTVKFGNLSTAVLRVLLKAWVLQNLDSEQMRR
jgi:hypothetical protein